MEKRLLREKYTEPNVRIKFIEPFLESMGWDVRGDIDIVEAKEDYWGWGGEEEW